MDKNIIEIIPVLPSENIDRDTAWYVSKLGFEVVWSDKMYALIKKETISVHLQWHANTSEDPLLGGSVIRILVKDIYSIYQDLLNKKSISSDKLRLNTPWNTHEFGIFDLNQNAIFFVQNLD